MSTFRQSVAIRSAAIFFCALILGIGSVARASEEEEHGQAAAHGEAAEHDSGHGGRRHVNEFSLFLGVTDEHGHDLEGTWGLDYERLLSEHWGIGGLIDYAGGDLRNVVVAVPVSYHPIPRLRLMIAPGIEYHNGRGAVDDPHHTKSAEASGDGYDKDETYLIVRLGVAYGFHIGSNYGVAPAVNLDLVNGEKVWIYGVNLYYAW